MTDSFGFTAAECTLLRRQNTPRKIQDFLDTFVMNMEEGGDTYFSPRKVLRLKKAHCMEGAMLACVCLRMIGKPPLVMDLKTSDDDVDHVVALFRERGHWGAISKTNHAVLRYRDPIYRTLRELALSYFHEYFLNKNGKKTLLSYSRPVDLSQFDHRGWMTAEDDPDYIPEHIDQVHHYPLLTPWQRAHLRPADLVERKAGAVIEWKKYRRMV